MSVSNTTTNSRALAGGPSRGGSAARSPGAGPAPGTALVARVYRLVDRQGNPHPVLDDLYDTLEAAWGEAQAWWSEHCSGSEPVEIGVEVSTSCGSWRTLRHPAC